MPLRKRGLYLAVISLLGSLSALRAQYVVTFQGGGNSTDPTVSVYDSSTFSSFGSLSVPGAFQLLSLADGTKHYFVSNTQGAPAITAVDNSFANSRQVGNLQNGLNAAALSPDGSRLVVATAPMPTSTGVANAVYIFDTASDVN